LEAAKLDKLAKLAGKSVVRKAALFFGSDGSNRPILVEFINVD
jgi:hypothetical protein